MFDSHVLVEDAGGGLGWLARLPLSVVAFLKDSCFHSTFALVKYRIPVMIHQRSPDVTGTLACQEGKVLGQSGMSWTGNTLSCHGQSIRKKQHGPAYYLIRA